MYVKNLSNFFYIAEKYLELREKNIRTKIFMQQVGGGEKHGRCRDEKR